MQGLPKDEREVPAEHEGGPEGLEGEAQYKDGIDELVHRLGNLVERADTDEILKLQQQSLESLEGATTLLRDFNAFSQQLFVSTQAGFQRHTRMAKEMRTDLESIMYRTRALKKRIAAHQAKASEGQAPEGIEPVHEDEGGRGDEEGDGEGEEGEQGGVERRNEEGSAGGDEQKEEGSAGQ